MVLPDACMDIVWTGGRLVVAGPDTRAHTVDMRPGEEAAGLRLAPGTAPALLGVAAYELLDQRVPLDDVWSSRASRRVADAVEQAAPHGSAAVAAAIESAVLELLGRYPGSARLGPRASAHTSGTTDSSLLERGTAVGPRVGAAGVRSLEDSVGGRAMLSMTVRGAEVSEIARETGWSDRQLRRHSRELFGYGLATLRRVLRLQAALRLFSTETSFGDLASAAGYSDQAHLARDVRALTGTTPTALFLGRRAEG